MTSQNIINPNSEKAIKKTIEDCSLLVNNVLNQPLSPLSKSDRVRIAIKTIIEEATRLKLSPDIQALLISIIITSDIAPYLMKQKCTKCQENPRGGIYKPERADIGVNGMFA